MDKPGQKSLSQRIGAMLFGSDAEAPAKTAKSRAVERPPAAEKIVRQGPPLPARMQAGTLQLVGLDHIRNSLGDAWPAKRDSVHRIVDSVVRRYIEPVDAYYKVDEERFLILFTRLSHQQAEAKAEAIRREAERHILGDMPAGSDVTLVSHVAEVDRTLLMEQINDLGGLLDFIAAGQRPAAGAEAGDAELFGEAAGNGEAAAAGPMTGAGPDMSDLDQSLSTLFQKKSSAAFLKECQAAFAPSFSIRRRRFSFYPVIVTHQPSGLRAERAGDPFLENPEELQFLLDRYALTTALLGLHRMISSKHSGIISIPVSLKTLVTGKLRDTYLSRLKEIPPGLYRYLCLIIYGIEPGTPLNRVTDAITYAQPFCGSRVLSVPPEARLVDLYAPSGCHGFETWIPEEPADMGRRFVQLEAFARRAALHKVEAILSEAHHADDIHAAVTAGFTFVQGNAVAPLIDTPGYREGLGTSHIPASGRGEIPA
ncbi:hypothetical protein [Ferrovibrio sp.]|uniref:hypothetical protein n=1 Tax=Ferrovibrio sp. TaxID=1917215 RepID=UPI00311D54CA